MTGGWFRRWFVSDKMSETNSPGLTVNDETSIIPSAETNTNRRKAMRNYLETLITEKGVDLDGAIEITGHFGLTWSMLVDVIVDAVSFHREIKEMLVQIDFMDGDIFNYLQHLAEGMVGAK